jgi:hypothetical protein
MDVLGLPPISDAEGVSAFNEERPQRDKVFQVFSSTFIRSEEDDSWQLVLDE